ncbi:MAG: hypothetical protein AAGF06_00310 [Pseudomonadota bacterium]
MNTFSLQLLIVLVSMLSLSTHVASDILPSEQQPAFTPTGDIFNPPAADLPWTCDFVVPWWCQSDSNYEYALEQEFWGHIGNGDYDALAQWNQRAKQYV